MFVFGKGKDSDHFFYPQSIFCRVTWQTLSMSPQLAVLAFCQGILSHEKYPDPEGKIFGRKFRLETHKTSKFVNFFIF